MTFDDRRAEAEELLRTRGAYDVHHPGGTLFAHLERVRMLLSEWGASECVQLAGLCHAAYGTDGFGVAPLALHDRPLLVDAIGPEAEDLVYLYARCDREQTYPTLVQPVVVFTDRFSGVDVAPSSSGLDAFMEITAANELDLVRHSPEIASRHGLALISLFDNARQYLSVSASREWDAFADVHRK